MGTQRGRGQRGGGDDAYTLTLNIPGYTTGPTPNATAAFTAAFASTP